MQAPRPTTFWIVLAALALGAPPALADTIVLKNGRSLSGKVVREDADGVTLVVDGGAGRITLHPSTVARVVREGAVAAESKAATAESDEIAALRRAATPDLEERLRALGPTREELLKGIEPTPAEIETLARLEAKLGSGRPEDAEALAGKGRAALVVAARALGAPERMRRAGAAQVIARLAADERTLPYVIALELPGKLVELLADEAETESPCARVAARHALETIARTPPSDDEGALGQKLGDSEKRTVEEWRAWWTREREELAAWDREREEERARIRDELARRGLRLPGDRGRIDVRLASDEPDVGPIPEPRLLQPRIVVAPPSDVKIEGEGEERRLRFTTILENRGEGALEVRASGPGGKRLRAVQRVFGRYPGNDRLVVEHEVPAGELVFHEDHKHFHVADLVGYQLLDETFAPALGAQAAEKVSVCLRDDRRIRGAAGPAEPRYVCSKELEGISPGWADVYSSELAGQELAIPGVADGTYWLVHVLRARFELGGEPSDRIAAARVTIANGKVRVVESLDGHAFLARKAERERAKVSR